MNIRITFSFIMHKYDKFILYHIDIKGINLTLTKLGTLTLPLPFVNQSYLVRKESDAHFRVMNVNMHVFLYFKMYILSISFLNLNYFCFFSYTVKNESVLQKLKHIKFGF